MNIYTLDDSCMGIYLSSRVYIFYDYLTAHSYPLYQHQVSAKENKPK